MNYIEYMDAYIESIREKIKTAYGDRVYTKELVVEKKIEVEAPFTLRYDYFAYKKNDTTVIMVDKKSGIRIYFSDYDIIEMLSRMMNDDIIRIFSDFFKGKYSLCKYKIGKTIEFTGDGLAYINSKEDYITKADTEINLSELIVLINLIIIKESMANSEEKVSSTLLKYLLFSLFFSEEESINKNSILAVLVKIDGFDSLGLSRNKEILEGRKYNKIIIDIKDLLAYNIFESSSTT